ncbi:MAG: hypothetical protein JOZ36_10165 [Acidobacteria bacterium]|nr:hypothetical protein [Acidobacteriota bacterium]
MIPNGNYYQMLGREELFERERHREPVPGWHSCTLASAAAREGYEETVNTRVSFTLIFRRFHALKIAANNEDVEPGGVHLMLQFDYGSQQ